MEELISRQQAIDVIRDMQAFEDDNGQPYLYLYDVMAVFTDEEELPTIQPDIVRCKVCIHYEYGICKKAGLCINKSPNGFCDWGERREVTT